MTQAELQNVPHEAATERPVYSEVVGRIQELVARGEFEAGRRLPSEFRLAETFGVSARTVRRALRGLAREGVVENRPDAGVCLAVPDTDTFVNAFARSIVNRKALLREIMQTRLIFEPHIAELAAINATALEIEALRKVLIRQLEQIHSEGCTSQTNGDFHSLLAQSTGNAVLQEMAHSIFEMQDEVKYGLILNSARQLDMLQAHRQILDAIESRDGVGAYVAMRRHLTEVEALLFSGSLRMNHGKA